MLAQHAAALDEGGARGFALAQVPGAVGGPGPFELVLDGGSGQVLLDRPERHLDHSAASGGAGSGSLPRRPRCGFSSGPSESR